MVSDFSKEIIKDLILVLAPLISIWLQQRYEEGRQSRNIQLEREKFSVENMRWVASSHLNDITSGLKKLAKSLFSFTQAISEAHLLIPEIVRKSKIEEDRFDSLTKIFNKFEKEDAQYLDALNEMSVYLNEEEEEKFRNFLISVRTWNRMLYVTETNSTSILEQELKGYRGIQEEREKLRSSLRVLLAPKNILRRLSSE